MQSGLSGVALPRDATQSAVLLRQIRPSVRLSVTSTVEPVEVMRYRYHTLEFFQNSFTISYLGM